MQISIVFIFLIFLFRILDHHSLNKLNWVMLLNFPITVWCSYFIFEVGHFVALFHVINSLSSQTDSWFCCIFEFIHFSNLFDFLKNPLTFLFIDLSLHFLKRLYLNCFSEFKCFFCDFHTLLFSFQVKLSMRLSYLPII